MTSCPSCGKDVRPVWPSCRACGALLMAAPAPSVPLGATVGAPAGTGAAPSPDEQFFAPAVLQPVVNIAQPRSSSPHTPRARRTGSGSGVDASAGKWIMLIGMVVVLLAAVAAARFVIGPNAAEEQQTPEVLPARAPDAGLPTSLDMVVRVQAESTRRTALQTVQQVGSGDIGQLRDLQPSYTWIAGNAASTDSRVVSVAQNPGSVTISVAASSRDVCAFGQWSSDGAVRYVTMAHQTACAAVNAPSIGWSIEAGGAASDLPDDIG